MKTVDMFDHCSTDRPFLHDSGSVWICFCLMMLLRAPHWLCSLSWYPHYCCVTQTAYRVFLRGRRVPVLVRKPSGRPAIFSCRHFREEKKRYKSAKKVNKNTLYNQSLTIFALFFLDSSAQLWSRCNTNHKRSITADDKSEWKGFYYLYCGRAVCYSACDLNKLLQFIVNMEV